MMANDSLEVLTDSLSELVYSQTPEYKFGGYKPSLLLNPLPPIAGNFLLCFSCKSILRQACTDPTQGRFICENCSENEILSPAMSSRTTIAELGVQCPLSSRGCEWNGTLGRLEEHVAICPFYRIECRNSCGGVVMRQEMEDHLLSKCVLREVKCELCALQFHEKQMNEHFNFCPEFLVQCSQCSVEVKRCLVESHIEESCESSLVKCDYSVYGCNTQIRRDEMRQHLDENKISHLEMKISALNLDLLTQKSIIELLQARDVEKNSILNDLKDRVRRVEMNCMINPSSYEFEISGLTSIFTDINSELIQIFQGSLGYHELIISCYVSSTGHLNIGAQSIKAERDEELEWPLKATAQVSLVSCLNKKNEYKVKEENITLERWTADSADVTCVLGSIGKSYVMGKAFNDRDRIRIRVSLQTSNPLLKRKPQYL